MTEKRCGTCKHFDVLDEKRPESWGLCKFDDWPDVPFWVVPRPEYGSISPFNGQYCKVYEQK